MQRTVSEVARLTGVTVRTLHHWDSVGLLVPSARTDAGYRLYDDADLRRLRAILVARELGMSLEGIRRHLGGSNEDRLAHLNQHRDALAKRSQDLQRALRAVDREIAELTTPEATMPLDDDAISEQFADFDHETHAGEAEQRWGDTDAWAESRRRMKGYGPDQLAAIKEEAAATTLGFARAMQAGHAPDSVAGIDAAETHREHIERWFYPCSRAMHAQVAQAWTEDPRFAATYEAAAPGLAAWARAAVEANARRE